VNRHPLDEALLRASRAEEHLEALDREIAVYVEANEAASLIKVEGMTVSAIWPPEPPPMLSVRVGEIVYNLRAALDYFVYRLAELDAGNVIKGTQFPIEDTPEGFKRRTPRFLRGVNETHVAGIERLQPYHGADWARLLRDLSNIDKHQALHVVGYQATGSVRINVGGTEEEANALGGFRIAGDDVAMYYPAPIYVAFPDGTPIEETLKQLLTETRNVLHAFHPEFKGQALKRSVKRHMSATPIRVRPPIDKGE
jgi:hypothetical protein